MCRPAVGRCPGRAEVSVLVPCRSCDLSFHSSCPILRYRRRAVQRPHPRDRPWGCPPRSRPGSGGPPRWPARCRTAAAAPRHPLPAVPGRATSRRRSPTASAATTPHGRPRAVSVEGGAVRRGALAQGRECRQRRQHRREEDGDGRERTDDLPPGRPVGHQVDDDRIRRQGEGWGGHGASVVSAPALQGPVPYPARAPAPIIPCAPPGGRHR